MDLVAPPFFPCRRFYRTYFIGRYKRQLPEVAMKNRFALGIPEPLSNYSEQNQCLAMSSWYMTLQLLCNCQNPLLVFFLMLQLPFRVLATSILTKTPKAEIAGFFVYCLHCNHQIAGGMLTLGGLTLIPLQNLLYNRNSLYCENL